MKVTAAGEKGWKAGLLLRPEAESLPSVLGSAKALVNGFLEWFGELGLFSWRVLRAAVTPPFEFREFGRAT